MPRMTRPPDRLSSIETPSATRTGSCHGSTTTIVPSCTWLGAPRHVREELESVGHHRVAREVVLDRPDGVEAEWLGEASELQLVRVDLVVGPCRRPLEDE